MKKPPVRTYPYQGLLRSDIYIIAYRTPKINDIHNHFVHTDEMVRVPWEKQKRECRNRRQRRRVKDVNDASFWAIFTLFLQKTVNR
jgi:hypothetical protein